MKFNRELQETLDYIISEQHDFNNRIRERLDRRYPTKMGKVFANTEAMIDEIGEVHQELKPYWQWWRGVEIPYQFLEISNAKKERLIDEHMDIFKFLLSNFILLGIDTPQKFLEAYMQKHKIIHERLDKALIGEDEYLKTNDGNSSLE